MPNGDGKGPKGDGPRTGQGRGQGRGTGKGAGRMTGGQQGTCPPKKIPIIDRFTKVEK